jgi:hypothetical protein
MNTEPTTQPTNVRPVINTSQKLGGHLKTAEKAGQDAKAALDKQQLAQAAADKIKLQWNALSEEFERLRTRVTGAREAVSFGVERSEFERQHYFGYIGAAHGTNAQYVQRASEIASKLASIALMKEGVKHAEQIFDEHRKKMIVFAREHGVATEKIKELESVTL